MNTNSPYDSPQSNVEVRKQSRGILWKIGTSILVAGMLVLAYGATAFWFIRSLPPNDVAYGRLPSLYVMGVGILVSVIGLVIRGLRIGREDTDTIQGMNKGIPTSYVVIGFIVVLITLFAVISQM